MTRGEAAGRAVRILRQKAERPGRRVRAVYARVGADEPPAGLGDQHPRRGANHPARLPKHHRRLDRVLSGERGESLRSFVGSDFREPQESALGLGDHFLTEDEDVAFGYGKALPGGSLPSETR